MAAFGLTRVGVLLAGVRFDASWLDRAFQMLDPDLLRHDLVRSLLYQHTQPPLFNLAVGLAVRFGGRADIIILQLCYIGTGLVLTLAVFDIVRQLGAGRWTANAVTAVVACAPTVLLFEGSLLYEAPLTAGVAVLVASFGRWAKDATTASLLAMVGSAGSLVLTRSLFHPVFYVAVVGLAVVVRRPPSWRAAGAIVMIPTLLIGAVIAKNVLLYREPSTSSWFGMNLSRVTVESLPPTEREHLVRNGVLSALARIDSFQEYAAYEPVVGPCTPSHGDVPLLARAVKSTRYPNFDYECFLPVYRTFRENALAALRAEPERAALTWAVGAQVYFTPASLYPFLNENRSSVEGVDHLYRAIVLGEVRLPIIHRLPTVDALLDESGRLELSLTALAAVLFVLAGAVTAIRRRCHRRGDPVRLIAGFVTAYVSTVGMLLEIGENYRFRVLIEPVAMAVLLSAVVMAGARRWQTGHWGRTANVHEP